MRRFSLRKMLARLAAPRSDHHRNALPVLVEGLEHRRMLAGRGLTAYYFDSSDFTKLAHRQEDAQVLFDWSSAPAGSRDGSYGVRWSARVMPKYSEIYNFYTRTTGGVRLWVNNQLIIDDWTTHGLKDNKGSIALAAGVRYELRVEYFDDSGASRAELHWSSRRQRREAVPQNRLFASTPDVTPPTPASRLRTSYVTDTAFKFLWHGSADDTSPTLVYETYIGKTKLGSTRDLYYTRAGRVAETTYGVSVRAIDWAGNVSYSQPLMITTAAAPTPGNGTGLSGLYFGESDFTRFMLTRTDAQINFNWNGSAIEEGVDRPFSARWSGRLLAQYDELYTFAIVTDGAARLWINNILVIDAPDAQNIAEHTGNMKLRAGRTYSIRMEYQHSQGNAAAMLLWSNLSTKKQLIPMTQLTPDFVDETPPSAAPGLQVDNTDENSVTIEWGDATDNIGVTHYDVYRDGALLGSTTDHYWTDGGLTADSEYHYSVVTYDGAGLASTSSDLTARTKQPAPQDALGWISASTFSGSSGISRAGNVITSLDDDDWVKFSRIDFGTGVSSMHLSLGASVSGAGGRIEVRLGSPTGQLIASHKVQPTGSYGTHYTQRVSVTGAPTGLHDVYLVFKNRSNVAELESFRFSKQKLVRIMPLGDSITDAKPGWNSYRYYLYHKLIDAGYGVDFVGSRIQNHTADPPNFDFDQNHEGHSGIRADEMIPLVAGWVSAADPDIVLLHIGTNDVWRGDSTSSTIAEIGQIIDAIRSVKPSIKIVLAQIIPLVNFVSKTTELNTDLATLATARTTTASPVVLVDMATGFSLDNDTYDGVHPDNGGASKMADRWYDALVTLMS